LADKLAYIMLRNSLLMFSNRVTDAKDELNRMDAECGDGDFGTSMFIAFKNVEKTIQSSSGHDISELFSTTGQTILSSTGGAAGPLFATLFLEAGKSLKGKNELAVPDLATMFENALLKIEQRGGAHVGDKTLVDALAPSVESFKKSLVDETSLKTALENALSAARMGYEGTKELVARQGRARYLAEKSVGYLDAGAYVITILFECLYEQVKW